jgi:phosphopantetheine adenylyltransferase
MLKEVATSIFCRIMAKWNLTLNSAVKNNVSSLMRNLRNISNLEPELEKEQMVKVSIELASLRHVQQMTSLKMVG